MREKKKRESKRSNNKDDQIPPPSDQWTVYKHTCISNTITDSALHTINCTYLLLALLSSSSHSPLISVSQAVGQQIMWLSVSVGLSCCCLTLGGFLASSCLLLLASSFLTGRLLSTRSTGLLGSTATRCFLGLLRC